MQSKQEDKPELNQQSASRKESVVSQEKQDQHQKKLQQRKRQDAKSIFLQNVDYKTTNQELKIIFEDCGSISRITILKDPFTKQPKGCAYLSFDSESGVQMALNLTGLKHRARIVKVHRKRTNIVGMSKANKGQRNITFLNQMMKQFTQQGPLRSRGRGRGR